MKTGNKVRIINGLYEDEWALIEWIRERKLNPSVFLLMLAMEEAEDEREAEEEGDE